MDSEICDKPADSFVFSFATLPGGQSTRGLQVGRRTVRMTLYDRWLICWTGSSWSRVRYFSFWAHAGQREAVCHPLTVRMYGITLPQKGSILEDKNYHLVTSISSRSFRGCCLRSDCRRCWWWMCLCRLNIGVFGPCQWPRGCPGRHRRGHGRQGTCRR